MEYLIFSLVVKLFLIGLVVYLFNIIKKRGDIIKEFAGRIEMVQKAQNEIKEAHKKERDSFMPNSPHTDKYLQKHLDTLRMLRDYEAQFGVKAFCLADREPNPAILDINNHDYMFFYMGQKWRGRPFCYGMWGGVTWDKVDVELNVHNTSPFSDKQLVYWVQLSTIRKDPFEGNKEDRHE